MPILGFVLALALQDPAEDFEAPQPLNRTVEGWERVRSDDHPAFNSIRVVRDREGARSGERFLRLSTMGRNTAFAMGRTAAWPADPDLSYRFTAAARLAGTRRNAASVSLIWRDSGFEPLREDRSKPLSQPGPWTELAVDAPSVPAGTRWVTVRLDFEGPDVRGDCDFDALRLTGRPRLVLHRELPTPEGGAIVPRLTFTVSGLPEGTHRLEVSTAAGATTVAIERPRRVEIALPRHEPGFYTIRATLAGPGGIVARRDWPLAVPNPWLRGTSPRGPFGIAFNPFEADLPADLARIAGCGRARVTLWDRGPRRPRPEEILAFLRRFDPSVEVSGLLAAPPLDLFPDLERDAPGSVRDLVKLTPSEWKGPLRKALETFSGAVSRIEVAADPGPLQEFRLRFDPDPLRPADLRELVPGGPAFVAVEELVDEDGYPRSALLALRAANDVLDGAARRADLTMADPLLRDAVFERDGRLMVALWSDAEREREIRLGTGVRLYPPSGAVRALAPGEKITIGRAPIFLTGVDPAHLALHGAVTLVDPSEPSAPSEALPLRADSIVRRLRFRNPFPEPAIQDLRFRILEPAGQVRPQEGAEASLAPGAELLREIAFSFPPLQEEADVPLVVELSFVRDGTPYVSRVARTLRLVPQIRIAVDVGAVPGAPHARKVSIRITNGTGRPANLTARVRLPSRPEETVALGLLPAGGTSDRLLEYEVRDVHLLDPTAAAGECRVEEQGGERLHATKPIPLR